MVVVACSIGAAHFTHWAGHWESLMGQCFDNAWNLIEVT
jgi:hypothetical protein